MQEAADIARAVLLQQGGPNSGISADGRIARLWEFVFSTGVEITDADGHKWIPSRHHIGAGSVNHAAVMRAEHEGRARYTAADVESLVEAARTDPVARDAARVLAAKLDIQGTAISDALHEALGSHGERRYGPNPANRRIRDDSIIRAVWHLKQSGLQLYLNSERASGGASAFDVVSQQLISLGFPLSYDGVRKIWERHAA